MATNKFAAAVAAAAEQEDFNEVQQGGNFEPLAEGPVRLRFIEYIEYGEHESEWQGKSRKKEEVRFAFEVTGPKIEPREDGLPHIIYFKANKSLSEKSTFYKLFRKMNYDGSHKVFASMLGQAFRGQIYHSVSGEGDKKRTYAGLRDADGAFSVSPPYYDDPESGERRMLNVPEPKAELRLFMWALADKEQWDSLFIDGEWEATADRPAKSKNIHQEKIRTAVNWVGSPMQELLFGDVDVGDAERTPRQASTAAGDPLDNIPL